MDDLSAFSLWKQGAEGKVYVGNFLDKPAVVKERFQKKYRHPYLDQHLTQDRFKSEARMLVRCKGAGFPVPTVYYADYDLNRLCLQYFPDSITCKEYIMRLLKEQGQGDNDATARLNRLMEKLGYLIAKLHDFDSIHGDLTTSNFVIPEPYDEQQLQIIDFGLGYISRSPEDKSVDLYVLERAFLSSHPDTEDYFKTLLKKYFDTCSKDKKEIAAKFHEVRLRGRKRVMIG